jgi:hypothetical protein
MSRFVQRDAVGPVPAAGEVARPGGDAPLQAVRPASGLIAGGEPLQRPSAAAGSIRRSAAVADPLGGSEVAGDVESALASTRGGGRPLPPDVASSMGSAMGADLSGVRVHDNARADQLSRSVQAVAFTQGSNVYFSSGSYSPSTSSGQHLLAHELAHVVEGPSGGSGGALSRSTVGRADDPAEAAADRVADQTLAALRRTTAPATSVIDLEHPRLHESGGGHDHEPGAIAREIRRKGGKNEGKDVTVVAEQGADHASYVEAESLQQKIAAHARGTAEVH